MADLALLAGKRVAILVEFIHYMTPLVLIEEVRSRPYFAHHNRGAARGLCDAQRSARYSRMSCRNSSRDCAFFRNAPRITLLVMCELSLTPRHWVHR